jgi:uncharacterized protein YkwD
MTKNRRLPVINRVIVPLGIFAIVCTASVFLGLSRAERNIEPQQAQEQSDVTESAQQSKLNADLIEQLINNERAELGLPALIHSEALRASACAKLDHMVTYNYWSHDAPDGTEPWHFFDVVGYSYSKAGENLAYGQQSESEVITDWMESPTHRDNIVAEFTESGLCTRLEKYQGWTQTITVHHFGTRQ